MSKRKRINSKVLELSEKDDEVFYWAMILPFLPVKDLFCSQIVCTYFWKLVHTASVWSNYFEIRDIIFISTRLRSIILRDPKACFMYTRIFVATDVLKDFLVEECSSSLSQKNERDYDFPLLFCDGYEEEFLWSECSYLDREIIKIDPIYRDVIIKVSISEEVANRFKNLPIEKRSSWTNPEHYVGTRNLSQYKEWFIDFCQRIKRVKQFPTTNKIPSWYFEIYMKKYEESRLHHIKVYGVISLNFFWNLTCFNIIGERAVWDTKLEDILLLFKCIMYDFYKIVDEEDVISRRLRRQYLTNVFEILIHRRKMCY